MPDAAVLVTGGAGYVAPPLVRRLAASGRPVVVLDDLSTGCRAHLRWGTFVEGDVADAELVRHLIREHGIVALVHFAAKSLVGESVEKPELYDACNRGKTRVLAETAAETGVKAFVFSSTAAVYGNPVEVPIPEDHARRPVNPYGHSKVGCEDALFATGVPTAALRYFNAAGAEAEFGLGERHEPETHLLPLTLRATQTGTPLTILGTDYDTPDGTCVRDYVHVADLAEAHLAALARLEGGRPGGVWNLGSGEGSSVRQVLGTVGFIVGTPVPFVEGERREGDPPVLVARVDRARAELGWEARRSSLERIVTDAWAFHREHGFGAPS